MSIESIRSWHDERLQAATLGCTRKWVPISASCMLLRTIPQQRPKPWRKALADVVEACAIFDKLPLVVNLLHHGFMGSGGSLLWNRVLG